MNASSHLRHLPNGDAKMMAGQRLLEIYSALADQGAHLFSDLLAGQTPTQWAHYPPDDAIDHANGYQWFYHSHSPEDRPGASEHGHIHLFARRKLWSRRLRSKREIEFGKLVRGAESSRDTRHLLTIGFDAKGVPTTLFTVNSWVTGDLMLSADLTSELLGNMVLDTGNVVDKVIKSLTTLYRDEIHALLERRDRVLLAWKGSNVLFDEQLELLSETPINVDARLASLGACKPAGIWQWPAHHRQ